MRRKAVLLMGALAVAAAGCGSGSSNDAASSVAATQPPRLTATTPACPAKAREESRVSYAQLPPAPKAQVDRVRAAWAHKYPTAAAAVRAGWFKSTPSLWGTSCTHRSCCTTAKAPTPSSPA